MTKTLSHRQNTASAAALFVSEVDRVCSKRARQITNVMRATSTKSKRSTAVDELRRLRISTSSLQPGSPCHEQTVKMTETSFLISADGQFLIRHQTADTLSKRKNSAHRCAIVVPTA